jgi:hypothetical protein
MMDKRFGSPALTLALRAVPLPVGEGCARNYGFVIHEEQKVAEFLVLFVPFVFRSAKIKRD